MIKRISFDTYDRQGWPSPAALEPYFLTFSGRQKAFNADNDSWSLRVEGIEGTEHLPEWQGRIDLVLTVVGNLEHGVMLCHQRFDSDGIGHYSRGDLTKLDRWIDSMQGDLIPIGLFIPFESVWRAVKEFMEQHGALPRSIPWVAYPDLPGNAFPGPCDYQYEWAELSCGRRYLRKTWRSE